MLVTLATLWAASTVALAQSDDDLDDLGDDIDLGPTTPAPRPEPEPETDDGDDDDQGLDDFRDPTDDTDLLDDEPVVPGADDSENVYRAALARFKELEPDEEMAGWEGYLARYPRSSFRKRIEARMEELTDLIYNGPRGTGPHVDAMEQEIYFAHGMQLENLNPRTRLQIGFEWGLPDYLNLAGDYEHAVNRNLSFHGGVRRRYLGWSIETGARIALVKSVRTGTIVSLIADARLNTNPAYPGLRPQLAIGKRLGPVDAQIQGGVDLTYQTWVVGEARTGGFQPAGTGGASLFYAASDRVGLFAETAVYMKPVSADGAFEGGMFRFNVIDFGMKFFPGQGEERNMEVNFGATIPYMQQWWQFHFGSVMGQFNYYL